MKRFAHFFNFMAGHFASFGSVPLSTHTKGLELRIERKKERKKKKNPKIKTEIGIKNEKNMWVIQSICCHFASQKADSINCTP